MPDFTPRKTTYKGTTMRSRLEAGFARWLDENGLTWEYEPQAFGDETGQYLPDFRIAHLGWSVAEGTSVAYVEVKPRGFFVDADRVRRVVQQLRIIEQSEPFAMLLIISPDVTMFLARDGLWPQTWVIGRDGAVVLAWQAEPPLQDGFWQVD